MSTEPEDKVHVFEAFSTGINNATNSFNKLTQRWKEEDKMREVLESWKTKYLVTMKKTEKVRTNNLLCAMKKNELDLITEEQIVELADSISDVLASLWDISFCFYILRFILIYHSFKIVF